MKLFTEILQQQLTRETKQSFCQREYLMIARPLMTPTL